MGALAGWLVLGWCVFGDKNVSPWLTWGAEGSLELLRVHQDSGLIDLMCHWGAHECSPTAGGVSNLGLLQPWKGLWWVIFARH